MSDVGDKYGDGNRDLLQEFGVCEWRNHGMSMEYGYCVNTFVTVNSLSSKQGILFFLMF